MTYWMQTTATFFLSHSDSLEIIFRVWVSGKYYEMSFLLLFC